MERPTPRSIVSTHPTVSTNSHAFSFTLFETLATVTLSLPFAAFRIEPLVFFSLALALGSRALAGYVAHSTASIAMVSFSNGSHINIARLGAIPPSIVLANKADVHRVGVFESRPGIKQPHHLIFH